jgi:hypothetical protein
MYQTALGLYESRRSEMREDELRAFEQQNTILAEERDQQYKKELLEFQQDMKDKNMS